ncbi:MAG: histone deacetylase family protein [Betaproteobacteria bacterium]|nr:histone deacetylase family protein [Betaproteobacteria bacterium]MBL8535119.1 histone deacetylase family protein [Betaproteobacteria bacterium]
MHTAFIRHDDCSRHDMGRGHPECPARLGAVEDQLIASGILPALDVHDAPVVSRECLERVHDPAYLDALEASSPGHGVVHLDPDTAMNAYTLRSAWRAAGAAVLATDLVAGRQARNAFCNVRPPGHHALRGRAMGFCFINNVAVAAAHALAAHGFGKVAIVDFDVHHGNGTEDIFAHDPRVMMVSTFQHPFYPYSGIEGRSDTMVNVPLPAYSTGRQFRQVVDEVWMTALERFAPEMIFISAGFDAHRDDDMASLGLVEDDYAWVTRRIMSVADDHAGGRIVSILEGGYELHALGRSVTAHIRALADL